MFNGGDKTTEMKQQQTETKRDHHVVVNEKFKRSKGHPRFPLTQRALVSLMLNVAGNMHSLRCIDLKLRYGRITVIG